MISPYKGFGYFYTTFGLWKKMIGRIVFVLFMLQLLIFSLSIYNNWKLPFSLILTNFCENTFAKSFLVYLSVIPIIYLFSLLTDQIETIKTVRGAEMSTIERYYKELKKDGITLEVQIGHTIIKKYLKTKHVPVHLPENAGHILFIGATGTGKTNSILQMLDWYESQNMRCIILDAKTEYISKKFRPEIDLLFNPLDCDSIQWNFFDEINQWPDIKSIVSYIIPDNKSHSDPIWTEGPRGILSAIIEQLIDLEYTNCGSLWSILTSGIDAMRKVLKDYHDKTVMDYLSDNSDNQIKLAQDIKASMTQYIQFLRYMPQGVGNFTIDDWLHNGYGNIYITSYADLKETLKPALSLFLSMLIMKLLSLPNDSNRKIRFILDEINQLYPQKLLPDLLTQSRSKGSQVIIGIQDKPQFDENYGKNNADSIIGSCATQIIFRSDGPETAEYASKMISKGKIIEPENSSSHSPSDIREGISKSNRPKEEYVLMSSEVQMMPDLMAYIFPKARNPFSVKFQYKEYKDRVEPFVFRK